MNEMPLSTHGLVHAVGLAGPAEAGIEELVINAVLWLKLGVEAIGALVIGVGVITASWQFIGAFFFPQVKDYNQIRLTLARHLALALEFQLGADILSTAVAPSWDQIGKLGAIAVIRTALNYFLMREMHETAEQAGRGPITDSDEAKAPIHHS
jgi:uncharacterized membrane protein